MRRPGSTEARHCWRAFPQFTDKRWDNTPHQSTFPFVCLSVCCFKPRKSLLCLPPWDRSKTPRAWPSEYIHSGRVALPIIKGSFFFFFPLFFCCYKIRKYLLRLPPWARNKPPGNPSKNGEIALWPNSRVVKCKCKFHKRQTNTIIRTFGANI